MVIDMKTFAIVDGGVVVNRARAAAPLAENWIEADADIGWLWDGETFTPPPPPPIEGQKAQAIFRVDADVDVIYSAVIGSRGLEYEAAEREATAYAAAGYTGTPGPMVQSWADVKGWPSDEAADDILAQAAAWRGAMSAIRAQRLASKEALRSAADAGQLAAAVTQWAAFVQVTRAAIGI